MAADKALKLSELSLQQLDRLKGQLNDEVKFLSTSLQSLKSVQQKLKDSKEALEEMDDKSEGKPILVPLTGSMYVPGKLKGTDKVMVDIGTGYYAEKTVKEAQDYFQRRIDYVTKNMEELQGPLKEKHMMRESVVAFMQVKLQAHFQAMKK